jgi:hypothetical protein
LGGILLAGGVLYLIVKTPDWTASRRLADTHGDAGTLDLPSAGVDSEPAIEPSVPEPAVSPGAGEGEYEAPSSDATDPLFAPGLVTDPVVCAKLTAAGVKHDHHVFPQRFRQDFMRIGIDIDEWTVAVPAHKHLKYVHADHAWNTEWAEWLEDNVDDAKLDEDSYTTAELEGLRAAAGDKALRMLHALGLPLKKFHAYRE